MGSLPIMGIFGDHNEGKRATTAAAMTCFLLYMLSCRTLGRVLHPAGDFLHYLISREEGNPQFSVNAAMSFYSFKPLRCHRGQTGKQPNLQRGKDQRRSFSRSAEKYTADEHGGQKRSQKCGSDQQEHVPHNAFVAVHRPRPFGQIGVVATSVNTHITHACTLPASVSGSHF